MKCGVPQVSTLGSLLFLMHVHDMMVAVRCKLLDDSTLLVCGKVVQEAEETPSVELETVREWLTENN